MATREKGGGNPLMTGLSHIKKAPCFSLNSRPKTLAPLNVPGPGSYMDSGPDKTSKFDARPQFSFGSSSRDVIDKQRAPGPGAYGCRGYVGVEGPGFTCTPRRGEATMRDRNPGPGAHNLPSLVGNGPKHTATPRRPDPKAQMLPGPGEYRQDDTTAQASPKWGFGSSTRPELANAAGANGPGPGTYGSGNAAQKGPQYSMGSRTRGPKMQNTPGPGAHGGHFTTFGY